MTRRPAEIIHLDFFINKTGNPHAFITCFLLLSLPRAITTKIHLPTFNHSHLIDKKKIKILETKSNLE